jgi:hypothetical protein
MSDIGNYFYSLYIVLALAHKYSNWSTHTVSLIYQFISPQRRIKIKRFKISMVDSRFYYIIWCTMYLIVIWTSSTCIAPFILPNPMVLNLVRFNLSKIMLGVSQNDADYIRPGLVWIYGTLCYVDHRSHRTISLKWTSSKVQKESNIKVQFLFPARVSFSCPLPSQKI